MDKALRGLLAGCLGEFQLVDGRNNVGHILNGRIFALDLMVKVEVSIAFEAAWEALAGNEELPNALVGNTPYAEVALFDLRGMTTSAGSPSMRSFRGSSLFCGSDVHRLAVDGFRSVTAYFPGIELWAGISGSTVKLSQHKDNRNRSVSVVAEAAPELRSTNNRGSQIVVNTHWNLSTSLSTRHIYSPVGITIRSRRRSSWQQLVPDLLAVQQLVGLAYGGFVVADGGSAAPSSEAEVRPVNNPVWWDRRLMESGSALTVDLEKARPTFTLADVGGPDGLRRWLRLSNEHPRATGPLVSEVRFGRSALETRLLELAAGIEYWCAAHRRTREWPKLGENPADCLGILVGGEFHRWTGGTRRWADKFWEMYNSLKHNPAHVYDSDLLDVLVKSAETLLMCVLLNRVAGTKGPSRRILTSYELEVLRDKVRNL